MHRNNGYGWLLFISFISLGWYSCERSNLDSPGPYQLSYGDSILYLRPQTTDFIVYPSAYRTGHYTAFPDGMVIDENTGAINVTDSETGLRYRVSHTAPDGTITTTMVVLSGINYTDKFYNLSSHDTIASPVYNALETRQLPQGSTFDEGGLANSSGCEVETINGRINLAESVRSGLFGNIPQNDSRKDIDIVYRLNDESGQAINKLKVRLYYYTSMATVAPDLLETLRDREELGVFLKNNTDGNSSSPGTERQQREARPRPPCVVIIAN